MRERPSGAWDIRLGRRLFFVALMAGPMVAQDATKLTLEDIRKAWQIGRTR